MNGFITATHGVCGDLQRWRGRERPAAGGQGPRRERDRFVAIPGPVDDQVVRGGLTDEDPVVDAGVPMPSASM